METVWDQYLDLKNEYRDALVFFHVGGFYQLYYHDAVVVHRELGNRLLDRAMGDGRRALMCGVPLRGCNSTAKKLARKGYRVVLCSQGKETDSSGLRVRKVFKVVEPPKGVAVIDLSEEWDAYLQRPSPEGLPPPRPRRSRKNALPYVPPLRLMDRLLALDLESMTPMEAMALLYEWKQQYGESSSA